MANPAMRVGIEAVGHCGTRSVPLSHEGMLRVEVTDIVQGGARPGRSSAEPSDAAYPTGPTRLEPQDSISDSIGIGTIQCPWITGGTCVLNSIPCLVLGPRLPRATPHGRGELIHPVRG
jgi:hypothetical protein